MTDAVSAAPLLEARHLFKVFGRDPKDAVARLRAGQSRAEVADAGTAAVVDASFTVNRGEIFVIMGLSGSGKSTIIRMLNGLLAPTAGDVTINGRNVTTASAAQLRSIRRESVSMVFQHFALLPHLSVLDNAAYALEIQGVGKAERRERAREILDRVGLGDRVDALPDQLSGGMRQRVGIARALTAGTDMLLMDEAFSALDPLIRREMQEQLVELQRELGRTIVFITHDLNEAMFLGDRIAVMRDGRIVQNGTPEEILTDPANDYVAQFVQDVDRARVLTASAVMEPPTLSTPITAGVRGALRAMRENQAGAVFAIENRRLVGVVTDRAVIRAVKAGETDLRRIVDRHVPTVGPDDLLTDIVEAAVEATVPLAVVDEHGRLRGVIPRITLLAALGNVPPTTREMPVVQTPLEMVAEFTPLVDAAAEGGR
ncbi:MAG: glycine betaine ABC transporter ATP-binding protein [Microbacterium sp. 69-7]|uniref:Glycine betaine transport ATP-binding protein OpuAA n=2 Tax=Microbacterium TaxID=33882 RepID=A0A150HHZ1_9MICO|nr:MULTISPECIES: glycine betaine/L-proline ABC transporter ATP-binding protein [Microbacterium]EIC06428.1 glycine betaine/L-proline ABC transporter, ATPase subunit [Microbacterium laevaniformans OR221]KXZ61757.1 Glycine betaine transport ATP-binding protein OpuAA [Microbacterium laevaniformans]MBM7751294.1 glycine betaine/proline transport system ATP-binding protein [Microbacterium laevaniformans]OJU44151.1 MAG: glycine betaine ABC transporter ATP-binding protein [Microbacterium sp. 69-7]